VTEQYTVSAIVAVGTLILYNKSSSYPWESRVALLLDAYVWRGSAI